MKRFFGVLLSICMMSLIIGCSTETKEQSATYVLTEEEAGMFTMNDTQTLKANGDKVYELLETTTIEFAELDEATLELLVTYYDDTVANMQAAAPEGVEVSSSYEGNVYTLVMNLYLEQADIKALMDGGYLMGLDDDNSEDFTYISFEQTCASLEASGYTLKE